jgi:hypothetical protein
MARPTLVPAASKVTSGKPALAKEKTKVLAFVNWEIVDDEGNAVLRSNRGFSLLDNEYLTLEDKALIQLATENDGSAMVNARLRIVLHHEKPAQLDISKITVIKKAA